MKPTRILICAACAVLSFAWSSPAQSMERDPAAAMAAAFRQQDAALKAMLLKTPIVHVDKNSINIKGTTLGAITRGGGIPTLTLNSGILYIYTPQDFENDLLLFHLDTHQTITQKLEELKAAVQPGELASLPPAQRAVAKLWMERIAKAKTATDISINDALSSWDRALTGPLALTSDQVNRVVADCTKRQEQAEELGRLAASWNAKPGDPAMAEKIWKVYERMFLSTEAANDNAWLTAAQRHALGLDRKPEDVVVPVDESRPHHKVSVSASAGNTDGAKTNAEPPVDKNAIARAGAKIKFRLNGSHAEWFSQGPLSIQTRDGLLRMWIDAVPDHSGNIFTVALDENDTWAATRAQWMKEFPATPAKDCEDWYDWRWGGAVRALSEKGKSIPAEVKERLAAMIKETNAACSALVAAYRKVLEKPQDTTLQRELFNAMREAVKNDKRGEILCTQRDFYDPDFICDNLPWLLSTDLLDLVGDGHRSGGTEVSSTGVCAIMRPQGDKQHVQITAASALLQEIAELTQRCARKYFDNHKIKIIVDPSAADKPIRGMVEGQSPEELIKSLALRAGVTASNGQEPNTWTLK